VVVATAGEEEGVGSKSPVVAALEKEGVGDVGRVQSLTDDDRQEKGAWILGFREIRKNKVHGDVREEHMLGAK
jgi:hypothetical protein